MLRSRKCWLLTLALGASLFATPVRAAEVDKLIPADAQMVMVFNVRQALESPLAKRKGAVDIVKSGIDNNAQAKIVLAALGLDLTKDIESMSVSVANLSDIQPGSKPEKVFIIVRGKFDPDKIDALAKKTDTVKVSKEGNTTVYEFKDKDKGDAEYFTVIGKSIVAASPSKEYLLKSVKNIGGGSKELVKASAKADGKQSMWMAMVITEEMRKQMAANVQFKDIAPKLESISAGFHVSDALAFDLNINTSDGEAPKKMKALVDMFLPFILPTLIPDETVSKDIQKNLKITANEDALNVNLKVSEEILDKIIKLFPKQ